MAPDWFWKVRKNSEDRHTGKTRIESMGAELHSVLQSGRCILHRPRGERNKSGKFMIYNAKISRHRDVVVNEIRGTWNKRGRRRQRREARNLFLRNPRILLSIFTLVTVYVSLSLKFRWLQRLLLNKRWMLRFEDSVDMEQLKSHLRAGRHKRQLYFTYSRALFTCVISVIVLPMLTSPSLAVLLKVTRQLIERFLYVLEIKLASSTTVEHKQEPWLVLRRAWP